MLSDYSYSRTYESSDTADHVDMCRACEIAETPLAEPAAAPAPVSLDTTGAELGSKWYLKDAKKLAQKLNVSDEIIGKEEYKRRFGKDI